jgi:predicted choloylglycine hydrolase
LRPHAGGSGDGDAATIVQQASEKIRQASEKGARVAKDREDADHAEDAGQAAAPASWQDWQRWQEVDWSDWRSWLRRVAATDWSAGSWPQVPWEQASRVPWEQASPAGGITLTLRAFEEDQPGDGVSEHLTATWPAFRQWWRDGVNTRPTAAEARARLEEHMPELIPSWQRLAAMIGDGPDAGAALALWNPPPFLTGCSQAAVLAGGPALIRNYDWDYRLFDAVVARTEYAGHRVLGMLDCLWGLLDGVNDAGLAVSLTFGGRPEVGEGFGIPIVIRYVLEVCGTVEQAIRVLRRVPVHMSYNVTVLDRSGRRATVYVAPDRPARVTDLAAATNHQGEVEWAPYVAAIRSVERLAYLEELLADGAEVPDVVAACLRSPLYATRFHEGFGTLYTAEYRPVEGVVRYHWPDRTWEHSLDKIEPGPIQVQLGTP